MISSTGDPALDNLLSFDEPYSIDFIFGLPSNAVPHHAVDGLVSVRPTLPAKSRVFAPVGMEGTGETDSPPARGGFELLVPLPRVSLHGG